MVYSPLLLIFLPIITALIVYLFKNKHIKYLALFSQAILSIVTVLYFIEFQSDFSKTTVVLGNWDSLIGISLSNDAISFTFMFLTLFIWWMILIYVFDAKNTHHNFLFFLLFLEGVFFGLLQTNDLFNMFVFLELTTVLVTVLIAFKKSGESFRAGLYYLLLNSSGVLAFLMGIILVYYTFGTINILEIKTLMPLYANETIVIFAYALMLAGISVKSAFFPLFTWLPKAHGASQSAISALLSGLIVKAGLYLFIRINYMFLETAINVEDIFFYIGVSGALIGGILAWGQTSIKQLLAYSTVSQIGLILMGLSSVEVRLFYGGFYHILNHGLAKMLLFLAAGIIIKVYRTKDIDKIQGVFKVMPLVSIAMIIAMLSITGAPFLGGSVSKTMIKYGLEAEPIKYYLLYAVNISTIVIMLKLSVIFFKEPLVTFYMKRILQLFVLIGTALAIIILGVFYSPLTAVLFDIDLSGFKVNSLNAGFDYLVSVGVACLIYFGVVYKERAFFKRLRKYRLSFETANVIFIGYLALLASMFVLF